MIFYKQIKKTTKGFTLIELILTVIAIGIFGNITANILGNASKIYKETLNKITINEYKRRQAPIGIRVSNKAFGIGRRYPIINHFREEVS